MKKVKPCKLNELPPGLIGKMLVYKSGAIKLKLGSTLYDISVTRWVKPPIGKVKLNCNTSLSLAMGVAAGAYILTLFAVMSNLLYFCGMCRVAKEMLLKRYYSKDIRGGAQFPESDIVKACRRVSEYFLLFAQKCDHDYSLAEDFLEITPRKTIGELKECKEDGDYAVYGTIMGVIGGSDWFVAQCRCGIEVVLKLGSYYCEKSSKHVDLFSLKL
ncbi:hypothetical protein Ahy_Scaffold2g107650 [Arachis hypogaea]|uniref:Uncharacterized protein n=1 Tax=Arachis hypogaea TaxID=3818 RepID=A0A444WQI3_ARAHY|nr:hypothetical protein Ahy_Scaffold2g107650 [Arachis hypogaea]